jgi:uncharacterized membrane protein YedE/YeeE
MLHSQPPWYVAGPALGVCVVGCRLLLNGRLGVTGGYSELIAKALRRSLRFDWRGWMLVGIVLIGFGAKLGGGCPSGNGLSGTSMLSRASFAATATFSAAAIAVSLITRAIA